MIRIWAIFVLALLLLPGCGGQDPADALSDVDFDKATLASCLKASGARFAETSEDLEFFSQAETEDTASLFGFTYDKSAELFVDLWEDGEDPRVWLLWAAQPFEKDMSPFEIVDSAPSRSYVALMLRPSLQEQRAAKTCTNRQ